MADNYDQCHDLIDMVEEQLIAINANLSKIEIQKPDQQKDTFESLLSQMKTTKKYMKNL